jgi:adenine-specific DNA-methyltransferase
MNDNYLKAQIITYLGNKRKLVKPIEEIILELKREILKIKPDKKLICGDGFSGSGIISRMLKIHSDKLYTNDLAGYSETINRSFLDTPSKYTLKKIKEYVEKANDYVENSNDKEEKWIQLHWTPSPDSTHGRFYYTLENAKRIDRYRQYIKTIPKKYQSYLLSSLLIESSIHTNTNGQFSAYFKKLGGNNSTDIKRITDKIVLKNPIFNDNKCNIQITRKNTNDWITTINDMDIVYYDPPYNKHPYHIYYFLLDIINDWDTTQEIPETYRGQPTDWTKSDYNSSVKALKTFENLIKNTKSKYIIISYNNDGIIPISDLEKMLKTYGKLQKKQLEHKTYNKLKGIANYKRKEQKKKLEEYIYILDCMK